MIKRLAPLIFLLASSCGDNIESQPDSPPAPVCHGAYCEGLEPAGSDNTTKQPLDAGVDAPKCCHKKHHDRCDD